MKLRRILELILGLIFFVFGLNGFFHFLPQPPLPDTAMPFLQGLMSASYFFPFMKTIETICGFLFLTGFYVPLALIVLAPITLNIFLFHIMLAPGGSPMAIGIAAVHVALGYLYRDTYLPLFRAKH